MSATLRSRDDDLTGYTRLPWIAGIFLVPLALAGTLVMTFPETAARQAWILEQELDLIAGKPPVRPPVSPASWSWRALVAPLYADLPRGVEHQDTLHEIPAAPGVVEMRAWLAASLADPSTGIQPPPEPVRALLRDRQEDVDLLVVLFLERVPMKSRGGGHPSTRSVHHAHDLLLAASLVHASEGRCVEATRCLQASWLLMGAWARVEPSFVAPHAERTAVLARKLLAAAPDDVAWLDASGFVDEAIVYADKTARRMFDLVAMTAAGRHQAPPGLPTVFAHLMAANDSHELLGRGQDALRVGRALRDPSRCGRPLSWGDASATRPVGTIRELDRLAVQIELTRKLAQVRALQDAGGAWPDGADGIETSACHGLTWYYVGGTDMRLEPRGPALSWLTGRPDEPALRVASR